MQRLILCIFLTAIVGATGVSADVTQHAGPYGLTALVVERDGTKMLAWKVPNTNAKLLFIGSIYDGNQDLTWAYSRKLLGKDKLETEISGIETNPTGAGKLYIFFDPACGTCTMLFEQFKQNPPPCTLVWVPLTIDEQEDEANQKGAQWLVTQSPQSGTCLHLTGDLTQYKELTRNNYYLLKWLKGNDDPISVPTFAWSAGDHIEIKTANELTGGRLDNVLTALGKATP